MYKKLLAFALVVLIAVLAASPALAEEDPPSAPVLETPTELIAVLSWLAAGGAGPSLAFLLAKFKAFERIENGDVKLAIVIGAIVGVPLAAKALIDLVPPDVWAQIQPYWAVGVGALLIGWPLSQVAYQRYLREPAWQQAPALELGESVEGS